MTARSSNGTERIGRDRGPDMITFATVIRLSSLPVIGIAMLAASGGALAQTASPQPPVCIFKSASYSEGAMVCSGRLALKCEAENARVIWRVARDPDAADMCHIRHRSSQRSRSKVTQQPHSPAASSKCFAFNGKTYCE